MDEKSRLLPITKADWGIKMGIRSTAKALIVRDGKILLNSCFDSYNGIYYSLPGGGQNQYETMEQALIRECLEETGHKVRIERFAALCEEISMSEEYREMYPYYSHKIYHIFLCGIEQENAEEPTELDSEQTGSEWIGFQELSGIKLLPTLLGKNIKSILGMDMPFYLGSERIEKNHG